MLHAAGRRWPRTRPMMLSPARAPSAPSHRLVGVHWGAATFAPGCCSTNSLEREIAGVLPHTHGRTAVLIVTCDHPPSPLGTPSSCSMPLHKPASSMLIRPSLITQHPRLAVALSWPPTSVRSSVTAHELSHGPSALVDACAPLSVLHAGVPCAAVTPASWDHVNSLLRRWWSRRQVGNGRGDHCAHAIAKADRACIRREGRRSRSAVPRIARLCDELKGA